MDELHGLIAWFGGIGSIAGSIIGGFSWVEGNASPEAKKAATQWLKQTDLRQLWWPGQFLTLFDHVFGKRLMTWKSFFRCALVSLVMCTVLTAVWYALRPDTFEAYGNALHRCYVDGVYPWCNWPIFAGVAIFFVGFNVPGDFISLIISRKIMGMMLGMKNKVTWLVALAVGTLACLSIYVFASFVLIVVTGIAFAGPSAVGRLWDDWMRLMDLYFLTGLSFDLSDPDTGIVAPTAGIFIYSSLFTVGWMWLFLASGWTVRFLAWIDPSWQKLKWFLDIDNNPIKSLGIVAGGIGAMMFGLVKFAVG